MSHDGFCVSFSAHFDSLDMLDKVEPPLIPDGFGISVAYACLLDIVRSISLAVLGPSKVKPEDPSGYVRCSWLKN